MPGRIYSVGYEGFDVEALVDRLASAEVSMVVDVRLNASSRRPGFSKRALGTALERAGIGYEHERDLGNPRDNRDSFRRGDGTEGHRRMRAILESGSRPALDRLVERVRRGRVAVLCVERDSTRCHRQVVIELIQELDPTIEVLQIVSPPQDR